MHGTPALSTSSMSTIPSPVFPEPVMPTMTPWVVKSAVSSTTGEPARWWVAASTSSPSRRSGMPGNVVPRPATTGRT